MLRVFTVLSISLLVDSSEPLNFIFRGVEFRKEVELAMKEHSLEWERAIVEKESPLDADHIIRALSDNAQLISTNCAEDIGLMAKSLLDISWNISTGAIVTLTDFDKEAVLPMLDSSGQVGIALLRGHRYFDGHFSECKSVDFAVDGRTRRVGFDIAFRDNTVNGSCEKAATIYKLGVCLPDGCSSADLMNVFRPASGKPVLANPVCLWQRTNDDVPQRDAGFYVTVSIMCAIALIGVAAGAIDYFFGDRAKKTGLANSLPWRLFMAFSLYSNISSIFDVSGAAKDGQIGPIHCIRFFSMSWVVMGHFFSGSLVVIANPLDILNMGKDFMSEIIMNAFFAVDSFFFMSGLLLTFIWFKNYHKNPRATNSPLAWIMFYVLRVIRLSPPFYMMVAFYTWVLKQLFVDLPFNMSPVYSADHCKETWYIEMMYAHNWWQQDRQCLTISWYLASEMQMYLFTPLLILPLAINPTIGYVVGAVALAISTAANIFLVYWYHWPANSAYIFTPDPEMTNYSDYTMLMYDSPLIRCQIYIMGMLVGWLLQTKKTMKIHPLINLSLWILGLSLMLCAVLGLHDQTNGLYIPIFWRALYSALSRIAFGLGLTWIIVSCYYGYGGPINKFMSWHIWIPFGRLTYCGYLTHLPIIMLIVGQSTDTVYFTTFLDSFITRVVSIIAVTFFVSTFWSALFEISFGKIQMILLGSLRPSSVGEKKKQKMVEEGGWTSISPQTK